MIKNKPQWRKDFRDNFARGHGPIANAANDVQEAYIWIEADPEEIESFIYSLFSKVIDEIELEKLPQETEWDEGYNYAVSRINEIKYEKKQKYGIK